MRDLCRSENSIVLKPKDYQIEKSCKLFLDEINGIIYLEMFFLNTLSNMVGNSCTIKLKEEIEMHLVDLEIHLERLKEALDILITSDFGKNIFPIEDIIRRQKSLLKEIQIILHEKLMGETLNLI